MRLLVLYSRLSGYITACLSRFKSEACAELLTYAYPAQGDAPFSPETFRALGEVRDRKGRSDEALFAEAQEFQPDAVLVSGWMDAGYRRLCRKFKQAGVPVVAGCDTQWTGSWRQKLAGRIAPWYLHPCIDILWVTGERQRVLARSLGYRGAHCWDGFYACDWDAFAEGGKQRAKGGDPGAESEGPRAEGGDPGAKSRAFSAGGGTCRSFLYVGRYAPEKGPDILAEAYRLYCRRVEAAWELVVAGRGTLREELLAAGARDLGFVAPGQLPALMAEAGAFVLPSRYEPWGVVLQEAAASGLPLIASEACGAGTHLLRDRWNGRSIASGSIASLAEAMEWMHRQDEKSRQRMGCRSFLLSRQYTPERWSEVLKDGLDLWKNSPRSRRTQA